MKLNFSLIFVLIICISFANAFHIKHKNLQRFKRSDEDEGFFNKAKTTLANFGSQVKKVAVKGFEETKKVAVKGYEETKNLFSKDRSVGDYTLDKIDARFGEDGNEITNREDPIAQESDANTVNRSKREATGEESDHVMSDMMAVISDSEHVGATESSRTRKTTLENNAEISPGFPRVESVNVQPLCSLNQKLIKGVCQTAV